MNWIKTEKMRPEDRTHVLIVYAGELAMVVIGRMESGKWFFGSTEINPPTHWMPLPSPPRPECSGGKLQEILDSGKAPVGYVRSPMT